MQRLGGGFDASTLCSTMTGEVFPCGVGGGGDGGGGGGFGDASNTSILF
jgi:hypothetical protein